jgi:hypothetical protein
MRTLTLFGIAAVAVSAASSACSGSANDGVILLPGWAPAPSGSSAPPPGGAGGGAEGGLGGNPDAGKPPPSTDAGGGGHDAGGGGHDSGGGGNVDSGGGGGVDSGGGGSVDSGGGGGGATGVPCDVATMLASMCTSCHSDPPIPSALAGLVTYADLMATAIEDPTKNEAQLSLVRMQNAASPMPPGSLPPASAATTLQNWINAGYPMGSCGGGDGGSDAGPPPPPPPPPPSVFQGAPPFASQTGPNAHNPGQDCLGCHSFAFGGTLYDGNGNPVVGAEVRLVDSAGVATSVYTGPTGNFYSHGAGGGGFSAPAHVGARDATNVQDMLTALQSTMQGPASTGGACNACHCTGGTCTVAPIHLP